MPVRLSIGKRPGDVAADELTGRKRLSSDGHRVVLDETEMEKNEEDQQQQQQHQSSFRPISPVLSPMTGPHPTWTGPISCVRRPLSSSSYTDFDLVRHLGRISEKHEETAIALGDVFRQRDELTVTTLFSLDLDIVDPSEQASSCEVYDICQDGSVVPRQDGGCFGKRREVWEPNVAWDLIKDVNMGEVLAFGRITILSQPSATCFAGIHMTLGRYFDIDELFSHLVSNKLNKGKTSPYVLRAFENEAIRRRSFFFVFKYYTVVDEGITPSSWQHHDCGQTDINPENHVNLSECSAVVALSLEGEVREQIPRRASKSNRIRMGSVFDTFSPFHVLSIRCFPDCIDSDRDLAGTPCHSGPQAFLECLVAEYKTAGQRLWRLNEQITGLVIPPKQFIFDLKLRDQLLFEDADFTFSRRYFWAYNSLSMVNDSIRSMINAYSDTFTPTFWRGQHPTLWPHPDPESAEGCNYLAQLDHLRHELEAAMRDLKALIKANEQLRREIENLREQLYSGSSVKENRTTIEQGENIKILTGVSMLFMPLTFVTSIFGMETFKIPPTDWRFVVIMVTVCVPFFILVLVLQTDVGTRLWRALRHVFTMGLDSWRRRARTRREKRSQLQQAAMIRRQSLCAPSADTGRQESLQMLNANKGGPAHPGMAPPPGEGGQQRWHWPGRRRTDESVESQRVSHV